MDYNGHRYWFDVVDCKTLSEGNNKGAGHSSTDFIKCQDCDIATDFLEDRETRRDRLIKKKEQQQRQQKEMPSEK